MAQRREKALYLPSQYISGESMGRMSKASEAYKRQIGMTTVEFVRHIRSEMRREGYYDKIFKHEHRQTS
jgi:hypothetical protein